MRLQYKLKSMMVVLFLVGIGASVYAKIFTEASKKFTTFAVAFVLCLLVGMAATMPLRGLDSKLRLVICATFGVLLGMALLVVCFGPAPILGYDAF